MRADRRIVDQAINRTKILAQIFRQAPQVFNIAEIEGTKMQRSWMGLLGLAQNQLKFFITFACDSKHAVAIFNKPTNNAQAESAASSSHDYVTHDEQFSRPH